MMHGIRLAAFVLTAFAALPASAQEACNVPYAPVLPEGATANRDQILEMRDAVSAFITVSDGYQGCLAIYLTQQEEAARRENREVDGAIRASLLARADSNQREKERIGQAFNQAVRAYNQANE